ncbi:MAG: hypothetical protein ACRDSK_22165 [Actinophytocola sp.]|uniref:hypothetical protein n=1 Tax=Actinophytocola sp. TaxID=1872138 RepID=UPI003D6B52B0
MSTTHRLLVAAVLAGVGLATAACAGNDAGSPATETVTVEQPAAAESAADPAAADHVGSQLPASFPDKDFPIPPGVQVIEAQEPDEKGIVLTGMAPDEVAAFYRSALPAAGYDITKDASVGVGGVQVVGLEFTGQGYNGKLAVVSSAVAISLEER